MEEAPQIPTEPAAVVEINPEPASAMFPPSSMGNAAFTGKIVEKNLDNVFPPPEEKVSDEAPKRVSRFKSNRQR